jgi:hypothetical protein
MKASARKAMPTGIMFSTPLHTFTIAAAWVVSSPQTSVKYVILDHKANSASLPAHSRTAMDQEQSPSWINGLKNQ